MWGDDEPEMLKQYSCTHAIQDQFVIKDDTTVPETTKQTLAVTRLVISVRTCCWCYLVQLLSKRDFHLSNNT